MRKSLWIMLAILLVAIGAPTAHADSVTLDVSGTMHAGSGGSCSGSGCTLGGDIVINNTTGAITCADVTISGESPAMGPFNQDFFIHALSGLTYLDIDNPLGSGLTLVFATPTAGSLVSYNGGPLIASSTRIDGDGAECPNGGCLYVLNSGALTPAVTPAAEPSSFALMLLGLGIVFVMRKRIGQRLPQAS